MMLLHSTTSSSTLGAHPHYPQRLPNLNLMVRTPPKNEVVQEIRWDRRLDEYNQRPHYPFLATHFTDAMPTGDR